MKINFPTQQIKFDDLNGLNNIDKAKGTSFGDYLNQAIQNVNNLQIESEKLNDAFAAGQTDNIQQVMIASEKAQIALQFTLQLRNKFLDAYQEIMRMPV